MHVSLDGFVAGLNGEMDWIIVDDEIFDYAGDRTDLADTALYGRVTFEMMEGYWPTAGAQPNASKHDIQHSNWYNKVDKVVLSKTLSASGLKNTRVIGDNVENNVKQLKQQPGKEIVMFGSPGAGHTLMGVDLIDEYWLFVNPTLLGSGIPMFKDIRHHAKLRLLKSHAFKNGVVCLHYERTAP